MYGPHAITAQLQTICTEAQPICRHSHTSRLPCKEKLQLFHSCHADHSAQQSLNLSIHMRRIPLGQIHSFHHAPPHLSGKVAKISRDLVLEAWHCLSILIGRCYAILRDKGSYGGKRQLVQRKRQGIELTITHIECAFPVKGGMCVSIRHRLHRNFYFKPGFLFSH